MLSESNEFWGHYSENQVLTCQQLIQSYTGSIRMEIESRFGCTCPSSPKTLTAIKLAALAIPDLFPPAVPLPSSWFMNELWRKDGLTLRECRDHCHLVAIFQW